MSLQLEDEATPLQVGLEHNKRRKILHFATITLALVLLITWVCHLRHKTPIDMKIRLYTNNIRYDNKHTDQGERHWDKREPLVAESIRFHTQLGVSVVCLQEVLHNQLKDLLKDLNEGSNEDTGAEYWRYYGVGRTDGDVKGEFAPILYKDSEWELVTSTTYWLSSTPEKPSVGWDAVLERIVTVIILKSKATGKKVKVLNTHFDHIGVKARRELVKLIMSKMELGPEPAFLCGDFNTQPVDEPYQLLSESGFTDSRIQGKSYGYNTTFSGFNRNKEDNTIIDYIWAGNGTKWQSYGVLPNYFDFYMSDHRPVIADYLI